MKINDVLSELYSFGTKDLIPLTKIVDALDRLRFGYYFQSNDSLDVKQLRLEASKKNSPICKSGYKKYQILTFLLYQPEKAINCIISKLSKVLLSIENTQQGFFVLKYLWRCCVLWQQW